MVGSSESLIGPYRDLIRPFRGAVGLSKSLIGPYRPSGGQVGSSKSLLEPSGGLVGSSTSRRNHHHWDIGNKSVLHGQAKHFWPQQKQTLDFPSRKVEHHIEMSSVLEMYF